MPRVSVETLTVGVAEVPRAAGGAGTLRPVPKRLCPMICGVAVSGRERNL